MLDQAKPVSRPWRRFLRLSVRGLIVIVLLTGGWFAWIVRSARIQHDAVAAIRQGDGFVEYRGDLTPDSGWAPGWLVNLLGVDHFDYPEVVIIGGDWSDADMEHVGQLRELVEFHSELKLRGTRITDSGLAHLKALTSLKGLDLRETTISEVGLDGLRQALPGLTIDEPSDTIARPRPPRT
jgi:hypothetical protein